ncbi:hypothetical protein ACFWBS_57635 [Streptomyces mirabilis]|uniref:hypothetical protein n=1 Tax=Streptomyces mirabilis TaxID=68239 RepID=UPI0036471652
MDLTPHVEALRRELVDSAEPGDATALAERLSVTMASATRLALLDALSVAADEITRELAPGSVHVRLRGRDPEFVVTPPRTADDAPEAHVGRLGDVPVAAADDAGGPVARINFRPPERLKQHIEAAAAEAGLSVNAWLVRTVTAALQQSPPSRGRRRGHGSGEHFVGWVS